MYPEHKLYGLFCLKGDKDLKSIAAQLKGNFKKLFVAGSNHRLINNPKQLSLSEIVGTTQILSSGIQKPFYIYVYKTGSTGRLDVTVMK